MKFSPPFLTGTMCFYLGSVLNFLSFTRSIAKYNKLSSRDLRNSTWTWWVIRTPKIPRTNETHDSLAAEKGPSTEAILTSVEEGYSILDSSFFHPQYFVNKFFLYPSVTCWLTHLIDCRKKNGGQFLPNYKSVNRWTKSVKKRENPYVLSWKNLTFTVKEEPKRGQFFLFLSIYPSPLTLIC